MMRNRPHRTVVSTARSSVPMMPFAWPLRSSERLRCLGCGDTGGLALLEDLGEQIVVDDLVEQAVLLVGCGFECGFHWCPFVGLRGRLHHPQPVLHSAGGGATI